MRKYFGFAVAFFVCVFGMVSNAFATITMPELPTTDLETAGTAVLALVAVYMVIKLVIRMLKTA